MFGQGHFATIPNLVALTQNRMAIPIPQGQVPWTTLLLLAMGLGQWKAAEALLEQPVDLHLPGWTSKIKTCPSLLYLAVGSGKITLFESLLARGVNPNTIDCHGRLPLSLAAMTDSTAALISSVPILDVYSCSAGEFQIRQNLPEASLAVVPMSQPIGKQPGQLDMPRPQPKVVCHAFQRITGIGRAGKGRSNFVECGMTACGLWMDRWSISR
jgi:hypothetical protein